MAVPIVATWDVQLLPPMARNCTTQVPGSTVNLPSMYGHPIIHGGHKSTETMYVQAIIVRAFFVVLLGLYVRGRVTEKYLSKLMSKRFSTEALLMR
jgi:hypothetical protein